MTLDDFLSTLDYDTGRIFVVQNMGHITLPAPGWLIDVHDFIRIEDYVPDDLLLAKVVRIRTNTSPWTVVVDLGHVPDSTKRRLRSLTVDEIAEICSSHSLCEGCPIKSTCGKWDEDRADWSYFPDINPDILNLEVDL